MSMTRRRFIATSAIVAGGSSLAGCASIAGAPGQSDYTNFDATELASLIHSKQISPSQALEWAIARSEVVNPQLNAIVVEHFDRARRLAAGTIPDGPLQGVPFLLKDLWTQLAGTVTTNGSRFFSDQVVKQNNTLADRYEAAGLVIFGKTASPEFGSSSSTESLLWGDTRNPWDPTLSSGGSSGGSAVAVATGIVPAAHASDGGGSIRIPASCCGIFGLKPSRGRTPGGPGAFDKSAGLGISHVVSRSVRDSALLLDLTGHPEVGDPYVTPPPSRSYLAETGMTPGRLRIGIQRRSTFPIETHPDCIEALEHTASLCESLGHELGEIEPPPLPGEGLWRSFGVLRGTSIAMAINKREAELGREATPDDIEPNNWQSYVDSKNFSAVDFERERQFVYSIARDIIEHQSAFDVVLSPTLVGPPPKLGVLNPNSPTQEFANAAMSMAGFTIAYNVSGQPAMTVPLHWNPRSIPIGTMFAGRPGAEGTLFRLAAQLEQAQPWADRRPPGFA